MNGENALHCAVQSDKGDAAISEVVLKLLKKRYICIDSFIKIHSSSPVLFTVIYLFQLLNMNMPEK